MILTKYIKLPSSATNLSYSQHLSTFCSQLLPPRLPAECSEAAEAFLSSLCRYGVGAVQVKIDLEFLWLYNILQHTSRTIYGGNFYIFLYIQPTSRVHLTFPPHSNKSYASPGLTGLSCENSLSLRCSPTHIAQLTLYLFFWMFFFGGGLSKKRQATYRHFWCI